MKWLLDCPNAGAYCELDELEALLSIAASAGVDGGALRALVELLDASEVAGRAVASANDPIGAAQAAASRVKAGVAKRQAYLLILVAFAPDATTAVSVAGELGLSAKDAGELRNRVERDGGPPETVSLASLFVVPEGFRSPPDAVAAATFAGSFESVAELWSACPRADWMLFALGWHRFDVRSVVGACVALVEGTARHLSSAPHDQAALRELERVAAWASSDTPSRDIEWRTNFVGSDPAQDGYRARVVIEQLVTVAKYGQNLGPALPSALEDIATWIVRAAHPFEPWPTIVNAPDELGALASGLRERVPSEMLKKARPPLFRPASWVDAKTRWASIHG